MLWCGVVGICKLAADGYKCESVEADREVIDEILSDVFVEENVGDAADNSTLWFSHFRILELLFAYNLSSREQGEVTFCP